VCVWLYSLSLLGVAVLLQVWADTWWVATVILFAPRWIWALPLALLVPAALLLHRRLFLPLGATALLAVSPVMGFELPSLSSLVEDGEHRDIRVVTYNIGGGGIKLAELIDLLEELKADVAVFQECETIVVTAQLEAKGWYADMKWGSCIASRYPIRKVDARDPKDVWEMNGSGMISRYEIEALGRVVHVVNVHLETVRDGLEEVMRRAWRGAPALEANMHQRAFESGLARAWAARAEGSATVEPGSASLVPLLVMGDFNMPVESAIYRRFWSSFTNAFSEVGFGFGRTKETKWHGIRIDHVLLGPGWICQRAWVGPGLGGDHRPMVVDLRWQGED
jgi:vancomycin resistance protein VanJ